MWIKILCLHPVSDVLQIRDRCSAVVYRNFVTSPGYVMLYKTSVPDVFSNCSLIPHAHFETRLVIISCYGYEI